MTNLIPYPILTMIVLLSGQVDSDAVESAAHSVHKLNARYRKFGDNHVFNLYKYPGHRFDGDEGRAETQYSYPFVLNYLDTDWEAGTAALNELRHSVAAGLYELTGPSKKLPPAADMKQVYHDDELTLIAERPGHRFYVESKFKKEGAVWNTDVSRFKTVSSSLNDVHFLHYAAYINIHYMIAAYTARFLPHLDPKVVEDYRDFDFPGLGAHRHYQESRVRYWAYLLWAEMFAVGCGTTRFLAKRDRYCTSSVCVWGPIDAKRMVGQRVYIRGRPRSRCGKGWDVLNGAFPTLCSKGVGSNTADVGEGGFTGEGGITVRVFKTKALGAKSSITGCLTVFLLFLSTIPLQLME